MQDLQDELGIAFLFISHDIAVVERVSHRIAVMYRGQIVEIGPTEQVLRRPQHDYTRKLLCAVPVPRPHFWTRHARSKAPAITWQPKRQTCRQLFPPGL